MNLYIFDFHLITFLVVYIFLLLLTFIIAKLRKDREHYFLYYMFIIFYYQLLFKVTMLPIMIFKPGELEQFRIATGGNINVLQTIPLKTITENLSSRTGLIQLVGNLVLLMPLVFILKYLTKKSHSDKIILLVTICVSIGIECIQYINVKITHFPSHAVDIDDLILNVFGSILALVLLKILNKMAPELIMWIRYSMIVKENN
ncbi:MAG TPA: hypothetical protein DCW90_11450 [Lachnospiraceae bacterium]|nr:hypothetical protein [Lachnospiraceae bacterium]